MLSKEWSGPLLAYAETGLLRLPEWLYEEISSPDEYALQINGWIENHGVQVVGGCCGTRPDHIRALSRMLKQAQ